jgi:tetratricopeptide (TPR) repeat protein
MALSPGQLDGAASAAEAGEGAGDAAEAEPAAAAEAEAEAPPPEPAPPAPVVADDIPEHKRALAEGVLLMDDLEYDAAAARLEQALDAGPYALEEAVQLYHQLGIARAYLDDEPGAVQAFRSLLAIAPGHALSYTTSPKATLLFQRAVDETRARRTLELLVTTPPVLPLDRPLRVTVERAADPSALVARVELWHRRKGALEWQKADVVVPEVGATSLVELPPVSSDDAVVDESGEAGVLLEVALVAYDARGWEVFRNPEPTHPRVMPVGFDDPGPWYTQWWLWGGAGAVAAITVATVSGVILALNFPKPDSIDGRYRVVTP